MLLRLILPSLFFLLGTAVSAQRTAQKAVIQGTVTDAESRSPLANCSVVLEKTGKVAATDAGGMFELQGVPAGKFVLVVSHAGHVPVERNITVKKGEKLVVDIELKKDQNELSTAEIPTVTLDEAQAETEGAGEVANLLHASRDIFQNVSNFGWIAFRFRERGYDSEHFPVLLNNVPINDPETGITFFGEFGGLNDVLRNRESSVGLDANDFFFSEIGGATRVDTRASVQRKQIRASYAVSNRAYRNRLMATYNTGLLPGGWALSVSASRRWATEGYYPGTPFDGYSYFLSADKKFNDKHAINLTFLGAPTRRGRTADSFQEMYDLAGTNFYNPNWGYQNGEVRNAAISHAHQPIGILRYDFNPSRATSLTVSAYMQAGRNGSTRIEWANAQNPAPDFNRRLPSSITDTSLAAAWADALRNNEKLRQIDWDGLIQQNRSNIETIENANGSNQSVTGARSVYIVEDRRNDSREMGANLLFRQTVSTRTLMTAGVNFLTYKGENFKIAEDLLGGDFWLDVNRFAPADYPGNPDAPQNNLAKPNNIVRKGDRFGYDYDEHIWRGKVWAQMQFALKRWQFFVGGEAGQNGFWRTGNFQNGIFANNSLGNSDKLIFPEYGAKGGATFKANGRNYLYANAFYGARAPQFRDVFVAPRTRNQYFEKVNEFNVRAIEAGYHLRSPYYRARLTGYATEFIGESETYQVFLQNEGEFGTVNIQDANRRHIGIEAAFEAKPVPSLTFTGAASIGQYYYTNRPLLNFIADNFETPLIQNDTVFQKGYYVPRVPQTLATLGVRYESKRFWFATLSFNWAGNMWFDFDETRRTRAGVGGLERDSDIFDNVLAQTKAPSNYTLDFFGGKSWRIKYKYFIYFNAGVNNLLNNRKIIISGRDAYLNAFRDVEDVRRYASEIQYAPGTNYFISLGFRM